MSTTPDDLLAWVKGQSAETEAACRAVVSRSYYAAYHHCDAFHNALPSPGAALPGSGGVHDQLIHRLQNPAPETKDDLRVRSKRKVQFLRTLKHMRVSADYFLQTDLDSVSTSNAVAKADILFSV